MNITKINYILASQSNIAFNVNALSDNMMYFGNFEDTSLFADYYDYNMICLSSRQGMIYNIYSINDIFQKSAMYCRGKGSRTNITYDFYPIVNHKLSTQLTNMIQLEGAYYGLGDFTTIGKYAILEDIYSLLSVDDGCSEYPLVNQIKTILYNRRYIHQQLDSQQKINSTSVILSALTNINYNQLFEMPGTILNDYQSSNMATNTFNLKNQYSSIYSMEHDESHILMNARQYVRIDHCNNQLYVKYYDRINYSTKDSQPEYSQKEKYGFTYQHIEGIYSLNRMCNTNNHRSNLYSIAVRTNIMQDMSEKLSANIASEIQNTVRLMAEKLMPANTQLFDVYVNAT